MKTGTFQVNMDETNGATVIARAYTHLKSLLIGTHFYLWPFIDSKNYILLATLAVSQYLNWDQR